MKAKTNTERGQFFERHACHFLVKQGYEILHQNYRYKRNEIDLIAREGNCLVFVEVKGRSTSVFGPPEDAVDAKKKARLKEAAEHYLLEEGLDNPIRFDILSIERQASGVLRFYHFKDAF